MNTTRKNLTRNSANTFGNASNINVLSTNNEYVFLNTKENKNAAYPNVYEPESLKISLITLNLASQSEHPPILDTSIIDCRPDFVVEMTQEDFRPLYPTSLFDESTMKQYESIATVGLNKLKATEQNVAMRVFKRISALAPITKIQTGFKILKPKGKTNLAYVVQKLATTFRIPKYGFSKGMVWTKIYFKESSLLFVNMHLPMKKKTANLGLSLREKALGLLLTELQKYMEEKTTLIIGGDLNFRMDYKGTNQLTNLLNRKYKFLQELPFPDPSQKRYTCKFKPLSEVDSACEMKRLTAVPNDPTVAEAVSKNLQEECAEKNRIPSRCDRFLFKEGSGKKVTALSQKALPLSEESDHNALVACLTVQ